MRKKLVVVGMLVCVALMSLAVCQALVGAAEDSGANLSDTQCVVCHVDEPAIIALRGGLHKSAVGCQDCHREHPPKGEGAIPKCSLCHVGSAHYALEDCGSCHANTHAPLELRMEGSITEPCLTCHAQQGEETSNHPSAHADLACNDCHAEHKEIPSCLDCHEGHSEEMGGDSCTSCHAAHMPLEVEYPKETPSTYCESCHTEAYDNLARNMTKHHELSCAHCHRDVHKVVPPCFACHGSPHPKEMMDKFSNCDECHGTAHDLRR